MTSQSMNINTNARNANSRNANNRNDQPSAPFGRYNNTWDEVFDIHSQYSSFIKTALKAIYGTNVDSSSSTQFEQFRDYVLEHDLTLYWSMGPGVDATHHSFVNGPWNSPSHLLVCSGPTIDIPLNKTKDSFLRLVMESVGYITSNSMLDNFLFYKADMQHLHGYKKSWWAPNCILRVILPSYQQLTGTNGQLRAIEQARAQTSPSPQPEPSTQSRHSIQSHPCDQRRFTLIRRTDKSLFVRLNTYSHTEQPEVFEAPALYHRPLFLKYDTVTNKYGYWIGCDSVIANKHTILE